MLPIILLFLTTFISTSHQQCFSEDDAVPFVTPAQSYSWIKSRQNFSLSLFKVLNKQKNQQNLIFSPWSIQTILLVAYFGAARETEDSLAKVLQLPANQKKPLAWHFYDDERLKTIQKHISNYPIKSANKIFLSDKLRLRPCMEERFAEELEFVDYGRENGEWAKSYINDWVESETDGQIKEFLQGLSSSSTATLVNAICFKSTWIEKFNPNLTQYLPFHVNPYDSRTAKMMVNFFGYEQARSEDLGARMLLLPYKDDKTAMIILLPDKDLDPMIESLNAVTLGYVTDRSNYRTVYTKVVIPKYEHKSNIILNSALATLGIGKTLTASADFSGFTGRKDIFFDEAVHEAVIQVDEEGTKASAATGLGIQLSAPIPDKFVCDRPFAYIIYDFVARNILFMGTFRDPNST